VKGSEGKWVEYMNSKVKWCEGLRV
jgi:hypothetical protein